ncbi:UvrD-helicase domain-containing protein (plasmid) [Deinococcus taeanensis]|uniref:3'-5' exonuclease n=1 Tax=Deinococcus taeanensis TaxID=2737050 RepID=UPI001CDC39C5|nr:3'-5' exonuclease [Deinococcus taeanensis]UBV45511.1 UvrD-helicase domain-containing protein [Deinococcus taeanensis]
MTLHVTQRFLDDLRHASAQPMHDAILTTVRQLLSNPDTPGLQVRKLHFTDAWYCRITNNWRLIFDWGAGHLPILYRAVQHRTFDRMTARDLGEIDLLDWDAFAAEEHDAPGDVFTTPERWSHPPDNATYPFQSFTVHQLRLLGVPKHLGRTVREAPTLDDALALPGLPGRTLDWLLALATDPGEPLKDPFGVFKEATLEQLEAYSRGQLQDLLLQLAPDQQVFVDRIQSGATLLKGVAGSGKTTVGIHRAVKLAEAGRGVLFITYNPVLQRVTETLIHAVAKDAPETVRVENYHDWLVDLMTRQGQPVNLITREGGLDLIRQAVEEVQRSRSSAVLARPPVFFYDEFERVIKGFGLTDMDAYRQAPRYGRKQALNPLSRAVVWDVFTAYNRRLKDTQQMDRGDLVARVYHLLLEHPDLEQVDDLIVDEAQDLTPLDLRVLQRLVRGVNAAQKSLLVLGDAAQSLYSRGFSWSQVGLDVRGRSFTLKVNYRNTREVASTAAALAERNTHLKHHGELIDMSSVQRSGPKPVLAHFDASHETRAFVIEEITRFREENLLRLRDIAIVTTSDALAQEYAHALGQRGIPADHWHPQREDVDVLQESVKVLTIQTAKGLEFPVVFMVGLSAAELGTPGTVEKDEQDILMERERMRFYVGMTRSGDLLYLLVERQNASPFIRELSGVEVRGEA